MSKDILGISAAGLTEDLYESGSVSLREIRMEEESRKFEAREMKLNAWVNESHVKLRIPCMVPLRDLKICAVSRTNDQLFRRK